MQEQVGTELMLEIVTALMMKTQTSSCSSLYGDMEASAEKTEDGVSSGKLS